MPLAMIHRFRSVPYNDRTTEKPLFAALKSIIFPIMCQLSVLQLQVSVANGNW